MLPDCHPNDFPWFLLRASQASTMDLQRCPMRLSKCIIVHLPSRPPQGPPLVASTRPASCMPTFGRAPARVSMFAHEAICELKGTCPSPTPCEPTRKHGLGFREVAWGTCAQRPVDILSLIDPGAAPPGSSDSEPSEPVCLLPSPPPVASIQILLQALVASTQSHLA